MTKPKRVQKSKAQILQEMKQQEMMEAQRKEVDRRRVIAKETLFPILLKYSQSIRHAQQICKIVENAIITLHNNELGMKVLSDLQLDQHFKGDDEASVAFREILEAFKAEKLTTCLEVIGGMSGGIDSFIAEETKNRKLTELQTHFL